MVFTTIQFILFFAIVFFAYYALPLRFRWWLLLGASWFFYAFATPYYLIFLGVTTCVTYCAAMGIDQNLRRQKAWIGEYGKTVSREEKKAYKTEMERRRKLMVAAVAVALVGMLVVFKYLDFLLGNINLLGGVFGVSRKLPHVDLILPIGLSFYVFQSLGYCIDVGRESVPAERNFFKHTLFVSYFPQILQGPIGDYSRLSPQLFGDHRFDYTQAVFGIQRIAWGFFKKVMIANVIADRINPVWHNVADYPGMICWSAILFLYAIQLYADFSGYMDIACGCSQMLGVELDENFKCPYFSRSIAEFWRNWHITLGRWFKDYVFYPLLRSEILTNLRKRLGSSGYLASTVPTVVSLFIVWLLIGLWHGADWSYVVYGLYHGAFVIAAVVLAPVCDRLHVAVPRFFGSRAYAGFQMLRTFLLVMVGYVIFKPADLGATLAIGRQMISGLDGGGVYQLMYTLHHSFIKTFIWIGLMFVVDVIHYSHEKGTIRGWLRRIPLPIRWVIYLAGLWLMIFYGLYGSGFDQFEYFKF